MASFVETEQPQRPIQIITTGDPEDESSTFSVIDENLEEIMNKIPAGMKVSVLSVVGAFRSGKSFLLTFFLRYLRNGSSGDLTELWMNAQGERLNEGNVNDGDSTEKEDPHGFAWRGGQERQTTGIWMWSEPFIWKSAGSGEPFAILLMDTQGMFDNKTTMDVTVQVFGLSTLVSSYQIYNVDKRIQEDNLQHLACFSEYGRMALDGTEDEAPVAITDATDKHADANESSSSEVVTEKLKAEYKKADSKKTLREKPFQRLEFLVRDWQNFDKDMEEGQSTEEQSEIYAELKKEMDSYFAEVVDARKSTDLKGTREQIARCFEKVSCFLLPHPGPFVTKKNYNGSIANIDPFFRAMLSRYVHLIFDQYLEPKRFNGREITGPELLTFVKVYAKMFGDSEGANFPKAMTMLEATSDANNRNAYDLAISGYRSTMNKVAGPEATFCKESKLLGIHQEGKQIALETFDSIANMGVESAINAKREKLLKEIEVEENRYFEINSYRNPFRNAEYYIIPLIIAVASFIIAKVVDWSCSTDFCEAAEDGFQNIYLFVFFAVIVTSWSHIAGSWKYFKTIVLPMAMESSMKK